MRGSRLPLIVLKVLRPRARSVKLDIRYITASTIPHARLQPIAAMSTFHVSVMWPSRVIDPVKVSTTITPNRISHVRSTGSSRRPGDLRAHLPRDYIRQPDHNVAVIVADDRALFVQAEFRRGHELAGAGS